MALSVEGVASGSVPTNPASGNRVSYSTKAIVSKAIGRDGTWKTERLDLRGNWGIYRTEQYIPHGIADFL